MKKMRAMVLSECAPIETNPLKLTEIDRHEIKKADEILLKIEACGVCHSQLHGIEGDWKDIGISPSLPTVPGHEVVGKVVEIGSNVTKFKIGDRAGITPLLEACKVCQYCKEGKEQLCESSIITGESLKGGYAEYISVRGFCDKNSRKYEIRICSAIVLCRNYSIQGSKSSRTTIAQKNRHIWNWRCWSYGNTVCKSGRM